MVKSDGRGLKKIELKFQNQTRKILTKGKYFPNSRIWQINSWQLLCSGRHKNHEANQSDVSHISYKTPFCFLCTYFQAQMSMASQDKPPRVYWVHGPVFLLCLEYLGSRVVPLSPCLPPPPHRPIAFFISRIAKENKHFGSHCQKTFESLFHHFSR